MCMPYQHYHYGHHHHRDLETAERVDQYPDEKQEDEHLAGHMSDRHNRQRNPHHHLTTVRHHVTLSGSYPQSPTHHHNQAFHPAFRTTISTSDTDASDADDEYEPSEEPSGSFTNWNTSPILPGSTMVKFNSTLQNDSLELSPPADDSSEEDNQCDEAFIEDYVHPILLVTSASSNVYRFLHIQERFHQSCKHIRLLEMKCDAIEVRYKRSLGVSRNFQYSLRLQLSVVEGVLEMFEQFALRKLHHLLYLYFRVKGSNLLAGVDYDQIDYNQINILHVDKLLEDIQDDIADEIHPGQDDSDSELELLDVIEGDGSQLEYYV